MHEVSLHLDGDDCWPDLNNEPWLRGELESAAYLQSGTTEGAPTVTLRIQLDNGQTVLAETTLRMYMTMAAAFHGKAQRDGFRDIWDMPKQP